MMKTTINMVFLLLVSSCAHREQKISNHSSFNSANECRNTEMTFNCVKVVDVYDGDTIFVDLPDQHPLFGKRMGVRVEGIDTPELRTKDRCEKKKGLEAKKLLQKIIASAKRIDILNVKKDKFFRVLGTVNVDGKTVSEVLIRSGLAFPYLGEKKVKRNWCF